MEQQNPMIICLLIMYFVGMKIYHT
uniref:Uncharacterized protein n=1 Tax=Rhizophora mucronata TaxID=61149 RepID=A0A2P2Q3B5_RHIMU